ncbi:papain-like cysteine protease family protein [Actinokineospora terrae]|uniref:Peptidase_C39 like family protein n=1 Tax=Actinokineospora terrae TaxID=155974 RepID=A0A1H9USZ8_9PSEU|nr:papain-like cysteine protease family protein [Actinokineospora terrae]SES12461.1 Peptidase_C39 like family protein [Actinokineospora terrae]
MSRPATRSALAATLVAVLAWLVSSPASAQAAAAFTMQAQQQTNWCWAASGTSIAASHGVNVSQNNFCALAKNRSTGTQCPNDQADLAQVRNGFSRLGFSSPGSYVYNTISYSAVQSQLNAAQPIETRILWKSGGGHMHVLYGFDSAKSWVYWGDPWPDNYRYNWATYSYYVNNSSFSWTHTLTGIRR